MNDGFYLNYYSQSKSDHRYSTFQGNLFFLLAMYYTFRYFNIQLKKYYFHINLPDCLLIRKERNLILVSHKAWVSYGKGACSPG